MPTYKAPVADMVYLLGDVFNAEETLKQLPGHEDSSMDLFETVLEAAAMESGTSLHVLGRDFHAEAQGEGMCFTDSQGTLILPAPGLLGAHQVENAAIAIAALRQSRLDVPDAAYGGIAHA